MLSPEWDWDHSNSLGLFLAANLEERRLWFVEGQKVKPKKKNACQMFQILNFR